MRLANEGRRKEGASVAWVTPLGIDSAHPKMDIAKKTSQERTICRDHEKWSNDQITRVKSEWGERIFHGVPRCDEPRSVTLYWGFPSILEAGQK